MAKKISQHEATVALNEYRDILEDLEKIEAKIAKEFPEYAELKKKAEAELKKVHAFTGKKPTKLGGVLVDYYPTMRYNEAVLKAHFPGITEEEYKAESWTFNGIKTVY